MASDDSIPFVEPTPAAKKGTSPASGSSAVRKPAVRKPPVRKTSVSSAATTPAVSVPSAAPIAAAPPPAAATPKATPAPVAAPPDVAGSEAAPAQYAAAAQAPYGANPYGAVASGPPQALSVTSMVLGIAGLFFSLFGIGFLPALAAVITGHIAQRREPHAKPFWLTGLITGYVGVVVGIVIVGFAVLVFLVAMLSMWGLAAQSAS